MLQRRRADLLRVLADVDRGIEQLGGATSSPPPESDGFSHVTKSLKEQIIAAMPENRAYAADEIVKAVEGQEPSVRSVLSRLARAGDLRSPSRGRYERTDLIPDSFANEDQIEDVEEVSGETDESDVLPNVAQDDRLT
ncbi:MAG: hypothetical protein M3451_08820 [Chloroflexota bacterium]|nr:hypothetical protein [Chloroflexota bacterium]